MFKWEVGNFDKLGTPLLEKKQIEVHLSRWISKFRMKGQDLPITWGVPWFCHHVHHETGNVGVYGIPMFTIVYPLSGQKWWGYMATSHAVVTPLLASSLSRLPCCLPLYRWRSTAAAKGGRGAPRREQKVQKVTYLFWETGDSTNDQLVIWIGGIGGCPMVIICDK